jgi:hypothetical protein
MRLAAGAAAVSAACVCVCVARGALLRQCANITTAALGMPESVGVRVCTVS